MTDKGSPDRKDGEGVTDDAITEADVATCRDRANAERFEAEQRRYLGAEMYGARWDRLADKLDRLRAQQAEPPAEVVDAVQRAYEQGFRDGWKDGRADLIEVGRAAREASKGQPHRRPERFVR